MLCEICHRNEANIHFTEVVDGKPKRVNICDSCARERGGMKLGIEIPIGIGEGGPELPFSLDDFFQNFVKNILMNPDNENFDEVQNEEIQSGKVCETCHTTLEEYLDNGMHGCKNCYPTFKFHIVDLLEGYMRTNLIPESNTKKRELVGKLNEIMRLRDDLEISVAVEDYESAGILRDKIQSITKKI